MPSVSDPRHYTLFPITLVPFYPFCPCTLVPYILYPVQYNAYCTLYTVYCVMYTVYRAREPVALGMPAQQISLFCIGPMLISIGPYAKGSQG